MPVQDLEPEIDQLSAKYEKASTLISTIIAGVVAAEAVDLAARIAEALTKIAFILQELASLTVEWIRIAAARAYRIGLLEAANSMRLDNSEQQVREWSQDNVHSSTLDSMAQDLQDDLTHTREGMNRDVKHSMREVFRGALSKTLGGNIRLGDDGLFFTDRSGRKWKPGAYVKMLLKTHMVNIINTATAYAGLVLDSPGVDITDGLSGDTDEPCLDANGEVWSVSYFLAHPFEHPNCTRRGRLKPAGWVGELDRE